MTETEISTDTVEYAQKIAAEHLRYYADAAVSVYDRNDKQNKWALSLLALASHAKYITQYRHDAEQYLKYTRLVRAHCDDPAVIWGRRVFRAFCTDEPADAALE
jgi:hypothetical protein